jgi:hypothetical protein
MISGFRHDVGEKCALLGYYTALNVNPLPMFRENSPIIKGRGVQEAKNFLTLEGWTDMLSQNVDKGLPFNTA